jgi:hypothetical protein
MATVLLLLLHWQDVVVPSAKVTLPVPVQIFVSVIVTGVVVVVDCKALQVPLLKLSVFDPVVAAAATPAVVTWVMS